MNEIEAQVLRVLVGCNNKCSTNILSHNCIVIINKVIYDKCGAAVF